MQQTFEDMHRQHRAGRFMGGLIVVAVGVILLLKQMGTILFPSWLFTWPVLLLVIGIYIGARHSFKLGGWLIIMLVGGIFLAEDFFPNLNLSDYIWPIVIISVGALMILPRRKRYWYWGDKQYWHNYKHQWKDYYKYGQEPRVSGATHSSDDYIDSVSVFGGVHKVINSKDFKGGDIVNIFGGTEINLSQADIKGRAVLDVVQIFGGTKIIIPSDWEVKSKMVAIFGGVEDKRNPALPKNPDKVLVIDGTSIFAGIDIISY